MSLYRGNYGHYNSSGNVLYGGYNVDKVANSTDFQSALDSYAAAKMWSDKDKTEAIAAAKKLVGLPSLRRRRYASTSKEERRMLTASIHGLTADMTPIQRKHGMQLLREATGAKLRPRVSGAAKQRYSEAFYDLPMVDYRNWMSPAEFAQGVPNGLYTPIPRRPVKPSKKRIDRNTLLMTTIDLAKEYAKDNGWAKPYTVPLASAALKIATTPKQEDRDALGDAYSKYYSYMKGDVKAAINDIIADLNDTIANANGKAAPAPSSTASSTNAAQTVLDGMASS